MGSKEFYPRSQKSHSLPCQAFKIWQGRMRDFWQLEQNFSDPIACPGPLKPSCIAWHRGPLPRCILVCLKPGPEHLPSTSKFKAGHVSPALGKYNPSYHHSPLLTMITQITHAPLSTSKSIKIAQYIL